MSLSRGPKKQPVVRRETRDHGMRYFFLSKGGEPLKPFAPSHSLFISISNINHLQHCEGPCEGSNRIHRPSHLRIPAVRTPLR